MANANARIRFFRIAYGAAAGEVAEAEIRSILTGMANGGRVAIDWRIAGPVSRARAKLAFLALQCLETALPFGGKITVYRRLAEAALADLAPWFPHAGGDWTAGAPLPGGDFPVDGVVALIDRLRRETGMAVM